MNANNIIPFNQLITYARKTNNLSNAELARRVGVHPVQMGRWLKADDVKLSTALAIANAFGISLGEFVRGE